MNECCIMTFFTFTLTWVICLVLCFEPVFHLFMDACLMDTLIVGSCFSHHGYSPFSHNLLGMESERDEAIQRRQQRSCCMHRDRLLTCMSLRLVCLPRAFL